MKGIRSKIIGDISKYIIIYTIIAICIGSIARPVAEILPIWEISEHPYVGSDVSFRDVVFINRTHGWVVGITTEGIGGGVILHSNDSGISWHEQYHDPEQRFQQIAIVDSKTLWVTGLGKLVYTTDGGKHWYNSTTIGSGTSGLSSITFSNVSHGWTSTNADLYKTTDAGQSWENVSSWIFDDTVKEFYIQNSKIWVISFYGIYYSNDFGGEWSQLYTQGGWSMSFLETGGAWAVGSSMLASSFDGYTWQTHELPRPSPFGGYYPPYFSAVSFIDQFNGWLGSIETPIVYTPNGGLDWYDQGVEFDTAIMGLEFINQTHGWAAGSKGVILRTTRGNEIGTRLWKGLTDYVILAPIGITIIGVVTVFILRKHRRRGKQLPQSNEPSSAIGIE
ncbi:MAG: YCF48-related protein [Candidatus Thorarchaeota archaeon]|nr:YCF48-related protein [Candidatus Thorarchaeota archaeon]